MRPSTGEFLYFLWRTAESFSRPTWRIATDTFEGWAWRRGLGRRLGEPKRLQVLERRAGAAGKIQIRLTSSGRRSAIGGREPDEQWHRAWDGRGRLVLYDVPQEQTALRRRLWRYLRKENFGFLQNSVWVTPDPIEPNQIALGSKVSNLEAMIFLDGRPHGGESDEAVLAGAWDFEKINRGVRAMPGVVKRPTGTRR